MPERNPTPPQTAALLHRPAFLFLDEATASLDEDNEARLYALLRERLPDTPLIIDAGLGLPSQAAQVMEWGYDAVLLNTAVALAQDPIAMASAFAQAVKAGRNAYLSGAMQAQDAAQPSTPVLGTPFWHNA